MGDSLGNCFADDMGDYELEKIGVVAVVRLLEIILKGEHTPLETRIRELKLIAKAQLLICLEAYVQVADTDNHYSVGSPQLDLKGLNIARVAPGTSLPFWRNE